MITLAEVLSAAGYQTAAVIANPLIGKEYQFDQGFDHFYKARLSAHANEVVGELLESTDDSKPLFLYVHTLDPHCDR